MACGAAIPCLRWVSIAPCCREKCLQAAATTMPPSPHGLRILVNGTIGALLSPPRCWARRCVAEAARRNLRALLLHLRHT